MTTLRRAVLAVALAAPLATTGMAFAQMGPPPPPQVEQYGPRPYPDGYWIRGHYAWQGGRYVWLGGRWEHRPRPRAMWVPGHYRRTPAGYVWIEGHWRG